MTSDAPDRPRGFIDTRARAEFARLAVFIFLMSFTNQQAVLLAVVWEEAGFSHGDIGLLLSIYGIPLVLMSLFSGTVANRIGLLPTVRIGGALICLGLGSLSLTYDNFLGSLASRLVQGVGMALFHAPIMTYGSTRLTNERFVQLFGLLSAMAPLPYAFGPIFAETLYHAYGARGLFLVGALPGLLVLPLAWTVRPGEKAQGDTGGLSKLLHSRRVVLPLISAVGYGSMFGFIAAYMAPIAVERGLTVGYFFSAFTASLFLSRLGLLGLIENVDRRLVVAGGALTLSTGLALAAFATNGWMTAASGFVFGLGHSVGFPVISAWLCDDTPPEKRAVPMALFNATFFAAINFIALPASVAIGALGYGPALLATSTLGVALSIILTVAWTRRFRRRP